MSSSKGLLPPRLTQAARLAMGTGNVPAPASGLLVYQTDGTSPGYYYASSATTWVRLADTSTADSRYIQNQTSATQTGGFKMSGAGTVGGALAIGGAATVGSNTTPGQVLTPVTSIHNMLAVAYGQIGASSATAFGGSGNYTTARTGTGTYTITFSAASGLSGVSLDNYAIVMSPYNTPSFITWTAFTTNGIINVSTSNTSGAAANLNFNFVVFQQ
ncbi:hypothetical protein GO988_06995 [Hymenobacter sp. HMF4947]|uniref:Uncharacterized protein n=1 Tax=Hymenobacter ginkgonis TaxID=2682976 RepID=A0A7K1TCC7_9BACT|nr:hypothetical protein [Hymenobacter ginkgonis]MVN76067.1 hypothetical protein [Hymenobacter ginkgonis]